MEEIWVTLSLASPTYVTGHVRIAAPQAMRVGLCFCLYPVLIQQFMIPDLRFYVGR